MLYLLGKETILNINYSCLTVLGKHDSKREWKQSLGQQEVSVRVDLVKIVLCVLPYKVHVFVFVFLASVSFPLSYPKFQREIRPQIWNFRFCILLICPTQMSQIWMVVPSLLGRLRFKEWILSKVFPSLTLSLTPLFLVFKVKCTVVWNSSWVFHSSFYYVSTL